MELDNFTLEKYDKSNNIHKSVITELCNDGDIKWYLGNIFSWIEIIKAKEKIDEGINKCYIAYYNDYPIGFILFITSNIKKKKQYEIIYGILPKYRKEYLASLLVQEFSENIFIEYPSVDKITAYVNPSNIASSKVLELSGYKRKSKTKYIQKRM